MGTRESSESIAWQRYLETSVSESPLTNELIEIYKDATLILTEGFEQRSLGTLNIYRNSNVKCQYVYLGRYPNEKSMNLRFRDKFEQYAEIVSPGNWEPLVDKLEGGWIDKALSSATTKNVIIDITALSVRGLFLALDKAVESDKTVYITYTEAKQYWPKKVEWDKLKLQIRDPSKLSEAIDNQSWLFGSEHSVEIIEGHEGYDSASAGRVLVAFLPFKCARLAAILGEEDYAECIYIAGRPRKNSNHWRINCLREINAPIIKDRRIEEFDTFGYRESFKRLGDLFLTPGSLLEKHDVHLAILGSKLQTVSCWAFSHIVPSLTCMTSVPQQYFENSFSDGIGKTWIFPLTNPT